MKKKQIFTLLSFICLVLFASCSSDSSSGSGGNTYPKTVNITYKVTSTTTNNATLIQYRNETGGVTNVTDQALPYTKTITRTVNKDDILSLGYGTNTNQTVKLEILVDNVAVKSEENTSTAGAVTYLFQ